MPPLESPKRPGKRSRITDTKQSKPQVGAAVGSRLSDGSDGNLVALNLAAAPAARLRQLLLQMQQKQVSSQIAATVKSPQAHGLQPQSQPQPTPLQPPPSQSQPQPTPLQSLPPSQPQSQAPTQSQTQPSPAAQSFHHHAQSQPQPHRSPQLPNGVVSVLLPVSLPEWAEEPLRGVDPFWVPKDTLAIIVTQLTAPVPGTHGQLQGASALFTVGPSALAAIADGKAQARLVCVQPGDGPPRRCHWYGGSYVLLNHQQYDVTRENRVQLLLGPNQADRAVDLSAGLVRGANRLTLLWPVGVAGAVAALQLCEPRPLDEVRRALAPALPLKTAAALVQAYIAGETQSRKGAEGGATAVPVSPSAEPASSDAEADGSLGFGSMTVSLRCPLHGGLVETPAHFGATAAGSPLAFFDLAAFLELARRNNNWICPASGRLGDFGDLRPHAFLTAVLRTLEHNGVRNKVEAIEVSPSGGWRPKDSRVPFLIALDADPMDSEGRLLQSFDPRLLEPENDGGVREHDVVDLTDD